MKKIVFISLSVLAVIIIYLLNLDRKVFFLTLGDCLALGKSDTSIKEKSFNDYIKEQLVNETKLEKYVNQYVSDDLRISDIVNDINNNKKVIVNDKSYNIKNLLIKADLVTISINHEDVISKLNKNYTINELYVWADELIKNYEDMLVLLRKYCKEEIYVLGFYYPDTIDNQKKINVITYLNNNFNEVSNKYKVKYIDIANMFLENHNFIDGYYPSGLGYSEIAKQIMLNFNN